MLDRIDQVVLPGDDIRDITEKDTNQVYLKVILGPGLRREGEKVLVIKPGLLKRKDPGVYWIDSHQRR